MLLEQHIHALVDERKNLENDIKLKRAGLQAAKKDIKSVRAKKNRFTHFSPRLKAFSKSITSPLHRTMVEN
jgi:hypothetical protein